MNLPVGLFRTLFYVVQGDAAPISAIFGTTMIAFGAWALITTKEIRPVALLAVWTGFAFSLLSVDMAGGARYSLIPSVLTVLWFVNWRPPGGIGFTVALLSTLLLFAIYKTMFFAHTEEFYDPGWRSFAEEYDMSQRAGLDHVAVFPQWPGTEWKIRLP